MSVKSTFDTFNTIEREYQCHRLNIHNVYIWPLVRFHIYSEILQKLKLAESAHPRQEKDLVGKILAHKNWIWEIFTKNPFFAPSRPNILFPHPRRVADRDIYSFFLLENAADEYSVIDFPRAPASKAWVMHKMLPYAAGRFLRRFGKSIRNETLTKLENRLFREFDVTIDIQHIATYRLAYFRIAYLQYYSLFKIKKPERVYVVVGYGHPFLIAAAQDLGIPVIELQHGTITPYHVGYSYPGRPKVAYQPDELWCFGRFWCETTELAGNVAPKVIGAPFLKELKDSNTADKDPTLMLFASQGTIGKKLFHMAVEVAKRAPEMNIVFRLHPSERRRDYEVLIQQQTQRDNAFPNNLRLSYHSADETTYDLLAKASYKVGVSSTTLFEAMVFETRVIVVKLPGWEYLKPAIEKEDALLVENTDDLLKNYQNAPVCADHHYYYDDPLIF